MKNTEMTSIKEVLELVHLKLGYDKDDFSQETLAVLNESGNEHYLIDARNMRLYINRYIDRKYQELHGRSLITNDEADTIIKIEGTTQRMRYCKHDVLKMLEDEHVKRLLFNRLKKRSTYFGGTPIASELSRYEIAKANGIITDKDQISFFEMIKNDSLDELKMKQNILQKMIKIQEKINELMEEEGERVTKELDYMLVENCYSSEENDYIPSEMPYSKFEEIYQLEMQIEKNYWYLSTEERLELENRYEELNALS